MKPPGFVTRYHLGSFARSRACCEICVWDTPLSPTRPSFYPNAEHTTRATSSMQPVPSPLTWALSISRGSSGKASALAPVVSDAQELLSREEDESCVDGGESCWVLQGCPRAGSSAGRPPPASQQIRQREGGHADPCRSSTRPSSHQTQPTNPSASSPVPPPDVPAPHPTPRVPPRLLGAHALHLLGSLGGLSQTRLRGVKRPRRASTPASPAGKQPSAITCSHRCHRPSPSLGSCRRQRASTQAGK